MRTSCKRRRKSDLRKKQISKDKPRYERQRRSKSAMLRTSSSRPKRWRKPREQDPVDQHSLRCIWYRMLAMVHFIIVNMQCKVTHRIVHRLCLRRSGHRFELLCRLRLRRQHRRWSRAAHKMKRYEASQSAVSHRNVDPYPYTSSPRVPATPTRQTHPPDATQAFTTPQAPAFYHPYAYYSPHPFQSPYISSPLSHNFGFYQLAHPNMPAPSTPYPSLHSSAVIVVVPASLSASPVGHAELTMPINVSSSDSDRMSTSSQNSPLARTFR